MTSGATSLAPGARFGAHEIVAFLGAGGMGEVWRARDTRLDREVALKVLPPGAVENETARARLLREARLASGLSHPHICTIHEVGEAEGRAFVAMELVEGRTLSALVAERALPQGEVVRLGRQLAEALAHAHQHGVLHRDFKSANVVVTPEGRAKVLDFGLAKRVSGEDAREATTASYDTLTGPGVVAGTLAYMAPEQLRGTPADARSDIWALGVVLYEMASGRRPFQGQTGFALSASILNEPLPPLPAGVPDALRAVVERCLEKDPARRYQRATEVCAVLDALSSGAPPVAGTPPRGGRWPWLAAGAAVLAAAVALAIAFDVSSLRRRLAPRLGGSTRAVKLAVLPFANLTGDPEQEYLGDGVTQEMIAQLGRLHPQSLSVIARTSVMRYKNTVTPIDRIGRELGVEYVLEGSAQREGSRIRISAELVQVRDQTQLWADVYERELSGILALQSDVARKVAGALALKLLPAEQARLANARAVDSQAYEAYLKGIHHWHKLTKADLDTAEQYFNLAVARDPGYAPTHAGLALVWVGRNQMGLARPDEAVPKAKAAALRAVELDDTLAEAHFALAGLKAWHEWDWKGAGPEFERAIALDPSYPDVRAFYSHYLHIVGRSAEAMPQIERALELDPYNALFVAIYAGDLVYLRRYDEAIAQADKALRMQPGQPVAVAMRWIVLSVRGTREEALSAAREYYGFYEDPELMRAFDRGFAEAGYAGAMRHAAIVASRPSRSIFLATDVSDLFREAGDREQALVWLEKGCEARDPNMGYLGVQPSYDSLRSEPRFQALLRCVGLPADRSSAGG